MEYPANLALEEFFNRITLIVGDVNSGKTSLAGRILERFCATVGDCVTVIDLAPQITAADLKGKATATGVGGRLQAPVSKAVRYHHAHLHPPRLRAKNDQEAEALAAENLKTIDTLIADALRQDTGALFINECSLYLHAGSCLKMHEWIRRRPTSVVNGCYGRFFDGRSIAIRERAGMEYLMQHCDRLIRLS